MNAPVIESFALAPRDAARAFGWTLLGLFAACAALLAIPTNPYFRWQQADGSHLFRARWVYERIHYDPTPIDVAAIGSSRMEAGIRAAELSAALSAKLGRPVHVVNFGLPFQGRDFQWTIAAELLETRPDVKLLILLLQPEQRFSHPGFRFLADDASIADAPMFLNLSYVDNLLTLPYRHLAYFVEGLAPSTFQLSPRFDPAIYRARSFDPTQSYRLPNGALVDRYEKISPEEIALSDRPSEATGDRSPILGYLPLDQRYANERFFTRRIAALARQKHVDVAFLSVPAFHQGHEIYEDLSFFEQFGPTMLPSFLADNSENYGVSAHLNRTGSARLTSWLIEKLPPIVRKAEERK